MLYWLCPTRPEVERGVNQSSVRDFITDAIDAIVVEVSGEAG